MFAIRRRGDRARLQREIEGHVPRGQDRRHRLRLRPRQLAEIDTPLGRLVFRDLDARQTQEVVDQPAHPVGLLSHDPEEARLRLRIVLRRAAQRLDKADEGGERRPQLMAGIGDEIGAHPFHRAFARAVGQQQHQPPAIRQRRLHRDDMDLQVARHRHRQGDVHLMGAATGQRLVQRLSQRRVAQQRGQVACHTRTAPEQRPRGIIRTQWPAARIQHHQRVGQALDDGLIRLPQAQHQLGALVHAARQAPHGFRDFFDRGQ